MLDGEGGVWATLMDDWSLMRFAPDGSLDRMIGLLILSPTDLAFGGPGLRPAVQHRPGTGRPAGMAERMGAGAVGSTLLRRERHPAQPAGGR